MLEHKILEFIFKVAFKAPEACGFIDQKRY